MPEELLDRKPKEGKKKKKKECRVKVTKKCKLQTFINYSYDKGGGNEMSFPASIQTLAWWNMTSGNSFQAAKIFSLLPAALPSEVWTVICYGKFLSLSPIHSK